MTCPTCGAAVRADAPWCGQCLAPLGAAPAPEPAPAPVQPVYSRWHGGDTSMGPFGKIAWTVGMVGFGLLFLWSGNLFAIVPWWLIAVPLVLRSVWARKRIA